MSQADETETVSQEIVLAHFAKGGNLGHYWTFEDTGDDAQTIWNGPFLTEELAIENAQECLAKAWAFAAEALLGAK